MSNWPDWLPLREDLKELTPYGAPQIQNVVALNTNENPFSLPQELVEKMAAKIAEVAVDLNRYPDRDANLVRAKLADYINSQSGSKFKVENIWAANGSNEILQTLTLAFGQKGALGFTPSYSMHPLIAKVCGVNWVSGKRNSDFTLNLESATTEIAKVRPSLVFVTTPNNPTGSSISNDELLELAKACAKIGALLVVDEAYEEFSKQASSVNLISQNANVIVVRTMSKAFALAGARVGYMIADPKVIEAALLIRLPYHLSSQTQALALVALEHQGLLKKEVELLRTERDRVSAELEKLGFQVIPSDANFLLFSGFKSGPQVAWQEMLKAGILIRDVGIDGYLRVTIGTPTENNQFLAAIANHRQ